jgi:hypothetical protein
LCLFKVRRIRGTEAPSTRHRPGSSLLPIPSLHAALSDPHPSCRFSGAAEICPSQTGRPCRCVIRLSRHCSLSSGCPNVSFQGTHSYSQTCIRSTFLSLNVGRVGSTLFNPCTSRERSIVFHLSLISLSAQSTQSKDHREARGLSRDRGVALLSNNSDHGSQGASRGERRTSLEMQVVFLLLLILESGC